MLAEGSFDPPRVSLSYFGLLRKSCSVEELCEQECRRGDFGMMYRVFGRRARSESAVRFRVAMPATDVRFEGRRKDGCFGVCVNDKCLRERSEASWRRIPV